MYEPIASVSCERKTILQRLNIMMLVIETHNTALLLKITLKSNQLLYCKSLYV